MIEATATLSLSPRNLSELPTWLDRLPFPLTAWIEAENEKTTRVALALETESDLTAERPKRPKNVVAAIRLEGVEAKPRLLRGDADGHPASPLIHALQTSLAVHGLGRSFGFMADGRFLWNHGCSLLTGKRPEGSDENRRKAYVEAVAPVIREISERYRGNGIEDGYDWP